MILAIPKLVVFDSATLGKVSRDYWSEDGAARNHAHAFLGGLTDRGIYISLSLTHLLELLAHGNPRIKRDRFKFLQQVQLIAWLRPCNGYCFPGGVPDVLQRELRAVVHGDARTWCDVVNRVRYDVWKTGTGSELFIDNDHFWAAIENAAVRTQELATLIASIVRTDASGINGIKLSDHAQVSRAAPRRMADVRRHFAKMTCAQVKANGDGRLRNPERVAAAFAENALRGAEALGAIGGDGVEAILQSLSVPRELITPDMTVGEVCELEQYARLLLMLRGGLRPPADVSMTHVPQDSLPSYAFRRRFLAIQRKASRVSGSDLGDAYLASLIFYADAIEVDKRTQEYLNQIRRNNPTIATVMKPCFHSPDYAQTLQQLDRLLQG